MAETANIAGVAELVSKDIFRYFLWHTHPKKDDNFSCLIATHKSGSGKQKKTHPTDVVFSYDDPYLGERVHLLTDLKSYAKNSISATSIRNALKSLAISVECAKQSEEWKKKFGVLTHEAHCVRGLLFVHNHDGQAGDQFTNELKTVNTRTLPIAPGDVIHFLAPEDIQRLFTVANDLMRLKAEGELPTSYTFYYPDLVLHRRSGDSWEQPATIESLAGPFLLIKHKSSEKAASGFLVYYNRKGSTVEEFEYLIDCFSRFQMIDSSERLRIRVCRADASNDIKSNLSLAIKKYVKAWGFGQEREDILSRITIDRVPGIATNYNPGDVGWRT